MANILVLHGPNLNLLGRREPEIYGADTLEDINARLQQMAEQNGFGFDALQSNTEGEIVSRIQQAGEDGADFVIINPAAFTHTSVAIRDAFLATDLPFIEVHLSNIHAREEFRLHSYLSDIAEGVISGLGKTSYLLAMEAAIILCKQAAKQRAD